MRIKLLNIIKHINHWLIWPVLKKTKKCYGKKEIEIGYEKRIKEAIDNLKDLNSNITEEQVLPIKEQTKIKIPELINKNNKLFLNINNDQKQKVYKCNSCGREYDNIIQQVKNNILNFGSNELANCFIHHFICVIDSFLAGFIFFLTS